MIRSALAYFVLAIAGVALALVGATAHRAFPPVGVVLCVVLVLAATVFARTWREWNGIAVFAGGWAFTTYFLSLEGSGGSVLIATDALGYGWLIGGSLAIAAVCVVPRSILFGRTDVA